MERAYQPTIGIGKRGIERQAIKTVTEPMILTILPETAEVIVERMIFLQKHDNVIDAIEAARH
jgi:hypothetical protein